MVRGSDVSDSFDELREFFVPGKLVEGSWESYSGEWQQEVLFVFSACLDDRGTYMVFHACLLRPTGAKTNIYYTTGAWSNYKKFWKQVTT